MAPTLTQLRAEAWWDRELSPPTLVELGAALRAHYGVPAVAVGIKGDDGHLHGGHRSPEWILRSRWSAAGAGDGSLILSTGGRAGSTNRDLRALDVTPGSWGTSVNRALMAAATVRLDAAVKAGRCPQVRRFWGTRDGRAVYGWDAYYRRTTSSDSSHLDHLHIEMYPDRVRWDHTAVYAAITGGDDMPLAPDEREWLARVDQRIGQLHQAFPGVALVDMLRAQAAGDEARDKAVLAAVQALAAGGGVDAAPILAAIAAARAETVDAVLHLQRELADSLTREAESRVREAELRRRLGDAFTDAAGTA